MAEIQTYLYGKKYPNRIFVGGLPVNTRANELAHFFEYFGHVTESKIILDDSGVSKGYGFVTFEDEHAVRNVDSMGIIYFKNKKINIGPAVKKESPKIEPQIIMFPPQQMCQPQTAAQQVNTLGNYYQQQNMVYQPPQQPGYMDHAYYQVANVDGQYWLVYPSYPVVSQNMPYHRSGSASSGSDDEMKPQFKKFNKRRDVPPRFMRK